MVIASNHGARLLIKRDRSILILLYKPYRIVFASLSCVEKFYDLNTWALYFPVSYLIFISG